ncbi:putative DUF341 family oxidoreductase [Aspergillus lucknowensis]|uniref:Serine hydrolase FSH n=1 Tax=Aspergillus lucknowensis TaxID=176173 RepID=A0ABR4LL65_9EURO
MPLRLLCLHGWGTNIKILQSQLSGLISNLSMDNTATFHLLEGDFDSDPGPGIEGIHDPPYYSYHTFPRPLSAPPSHCDDDEVLDAYDRLYEVLATEGPFDGLLGFSHGGTLAAGFLINHAKQYPGEEPPVRCAIFINSLPPFRMDSEGYCAKEGKVKGEIVLEDDLAGYINIPTVSIAGAKDPLFEYSRALYELCERGRSAWVVHSRGHDVPIDKKNVAGMAMAIRKLAVQVALNW